MATLLLGRLILAAIFPITADEAYFWQWGRNLDWTYYDHPFMTGWWVYLGQVLGSHIFFPRLIGIVSQFLVFWLLHEAVKRWSGSVEKAKLAGLALLVSPGYFLFFFFTTDTPLYFFSFIALLFFLHGFRRESFSSMVLAGIFVGLAFMSKYLIVFLALAMGLSLFWIKSKKKIPLMMVGLAVGVLPFLAVNLLIARDHCWWPLQFNFFNRTSNRPFKFTGIFTFLFHQVFLLTPWILMAFWKSREALRRQWREEGQPFLLIFAVAVSFLGLLSFYNTGLHWGFSFYPLIYFAIYALPEDSLRRILGYSTLLTGFLSMVVVILLLLVPTIYEGKRYYADYVMGQHGNEVFAELMAQASGLNEPVVGTLGYTTSGIMSYHSGRHFLVFKDIDASGRGDDRWTDYSQLDGRDFLLISTYNFKPEEREEYPNYFESLEYGEILVRGSPFYIVKGRGFRYANYRDGYLT